MFHLKNFTAKLKLLLLIGVGFSLSGCSKSGYDETIVYNNNFKTGSTEKLQGALLYKKDGELFVGRYNNGGFSLTIDNLPSHKAIQITAEPYFHDTWDGNNNFGGITGPDIWIMQVDGKDLVNATFSNSPCNTLYCLYQSYPANYSAGSINNPSKTEAVSILPGICTWGMTFGTAVYKIVKTISHTGNKVTINFKDLLIQTNVSNQLCDESWSMGGITVKLINTSP